MTPNEPSAHENRSREVASTSRTLLGRVRNNERDAWDRLVTLYTPLVYHWCRRLDLSPDDIPDVVQETFKAVAQHIHRFKKDRPQDTFRGWLRVIVRNKAMDHFRRSAKHTRGAGGTEALNRLEGMPAPPSDIEGDEDSGVEPPDDEDTERHILFQQALRVIRGEVQDRTWRAFWRTVVDEQPASEVAKELGMSSGAVRVAKCRVLQRVREELGDEYGDDLSDSPLAGE